MFYTESSAYCGVCGKRIRVRHGLFDEHNNKRNKICYGSFTPSQDINPFKPPKRKKSSDWDNLDQAVAEQAVWEEFGGNPGIADGT